MTDTERPRQHERTFDGPLSRRTFLIAGSAAAAAYQLARADDALAAYRSRPRAPASSVGYVLGSEGGDVTELGRSLRTVVPARRVKPSATARLDVGLHGLWGTSGASLARRYRRASLDALVRVPSGVTPYYAWTFNTEPVPQGSSPSTFSMHRGSGSLTFLLKLSRHRHLSTRLLGGTRRPRLHRHEIVLSPKAASAGPKLRKGIYLIGLGHAAFDRRQRLVAGQSLPALILSIG